MCYNCFNKIYEISDTEGPVYNFYDKSKKLICYKPDAPQCTAMYQIVPALLSKIQVTQIREVFFQKSCDKTSKYQGPLCFLQCVESEKCFGEKSEGK